MLDAGTDDVDPSQVGRLRAEICRRQIPRDQHVGGLHRFVEMIGIPVDEHIELRGDVRIVARDVIEALTRDREDCLAFWRVRKRIGRSVIVLDVDAKLPFMARSAAGRLERLQFLDHPVVARIAAQLVGFEEDAHHLPADIVQELRIVPAGLWRQFEHRVAAIGVDRQRAEFGRLLGPHAILGMLRTCWRRTRRISAMPRSLGTRCSSLWTVIGPMPVVASRSPGLRWRAS